VIGTPFTREPGRKFKNTISIVVPSSNQAQQISLLLFLVENNVTILGLQQAQQQ